MELYTRWHELSDFEKNLINNGCGPAWFPKNWKRALRKYLFSWMFYASCGHHDFGYAQGGGEKRRLTCDIKLARAMHRDVCVCFKHGNYTNAYIGLFTASLFFIFVVMFGWLSFEYGQPKNKHEIIMTITRKNGPGLLHRLKHFKW